MQVLFSRLWVCPAPLADCRTPAQRSCVKELFYGTHSLLRYQEVNSRILSWSFIPILSGKGSKRIFYFRVEILNLLLFTKVIVYFWKLATLFAVWGSLNFPHCQHPETHQSSITQCNLEQKQLILKLKDHEMNIYIEKAGDRDLVSGPDDEASGGEGGWVEERGEARN